MRNFILILRSLKRNRINSAIIVISLSVGFACLNLIATFLYHEFTTDDFHADKNRIFSVIADDAFIRGGKTYSINKDAVEYMKDNFAQVEDFCKYGEFRFSKISVAGNTMSGEVNILAATPNFFSFFSYPLLTGNTQSLLEGGKNIVISEKVARNYFGKDSPVGQVIEIENSAGGNQFVVSGVFKKVSQNSQLDFDMVVEIQPEEYTRGYIKLDHPSSAPEVQNLLSEFKSEIPILNSEIQGQYYIKPLKEAYFDTSRRIKLEKSQSKTTLWIILTVGILIMSLAIFNFLGIINRNLLDRSKSFSIYKLNGAGKGYLVKMILSEVLFLLGLSFLFGMLIMAWIFPVFNHLINSSINTEFIFRISNLLFLFSVLLIVFLFASLFIIYKLNSIVGIHSLKDFNPLWKFQLPAFNVFQIATTILLIVASMVIFKQIRYVNNKPIGIDKQVFDLRVPGKEKGKLGILKSVLQQSPIINSASITTHSIFFPVSILMNYEEDGEEHSFSPTFFTADEDFVRTLNLKIASGQDFSSDPSANKFKCLINESMATFLNRDNLIGSELPDFGYTIVGVVKDFNHESLEKLVSPAFIEWDGVNNHILERASHILIKTLPGHEEESLKYIKQAWSEILPDVPFEFETIEQQYLMKHAKNSKTIQLVVICCLLSILLSVMGLFAEVLQNSKLRVKEIGIRKVNGAKVSEILAMLNKDFIKWVILAFVIATPIAYYAMDKWLESFAYKTSLSWWIFALAGILALAIALLTVSIQSWKAATRNPVEALRYE